MSFMKYIPIENEQVQFPILWNDVSVTNYFKVFMHTKFEAIWV